ncbi:hypothetical protein [Pseudomonas savastanoi]|uniref:Uncharacterized protein n=1 Tax=Pseudomonas savastanoi pv. glycinea TaxID=318 RepID=A0A0P9VBS3_PSESG|nr:hypothetical protein [Pseudomonas savastanoi]EFW81918.1 hypothetical protein PsgB076_04536 [Pseudomonas savastanoi pv. glycinea str. B076]KPC27907.1 Uncharacterized protein AC497_1339 [Pseudomonas savastanoi pv. glycinea]KPC36067.1 Uncharacterized protein AC498_3414 [Pseudomonas savastanoi pv. glycinea]KPC47246.1 Uncharacterized protein AC496_5193 [Pseudomonas savastanoi pv. glycinea]KPC50938.1 Uncharacterized protein ABK00_1591 [Pseudomonas savastanoi pv. glycinea]
MIVSKNKALPPLQSIKFGARDNMNHLIQVIQGGDSGEGLALAADLALGVERLCARLDVATNDACNMRGASISWPPCWHCCSAGSVGALQPAR